MVIFYFVTLYTYFSLSIQTTTMSEREKEKRHALELTQQVEYEKICVSAFHTNFPLSCSLTLQSAPRQMVPSSFLLLFLLVLVDLDSLLNTSVRRSLFLLSLFHLLLGRQVFQPCKYSIWVRVHTVYVCVCWDAYIFVCMCVLYVYYVLCISYRYSHVLWYPSWIAHQLWCGGRVVSLGIWHTLTQPRINTYTTQTHRYTHRHKNSCF